MPRKAKPTTREEIRSMVTNELEKHPFIRLDPPPTRWSQLTDVEIEALPADEKKELIREELKTLRTALNGTTVRETIEELRPSQRKIYERILDGRHVAE